MDRTELQKFILERYAVEPDFPWPGESDYAVFRHRISQKWFALVMPVPKTRLGLSGEGVLDIANFKCGPILSGTLRSETGFFPAYHMNKGNWITAALDGSASAEKIKMLLDISYEAVAGGARRPQKIRKL